MVSRTKSIYLQMKRAHFPFERQDTDTVASSATKYYKTAPLGRFQITPSLLTWVRRGYLPLRFLNGMEQVLTLLESSLIKMPSNCLTTGNFTSLSFLLSFERPLGTLYAQGWDAGRTPRVHAADDPMCRWHCTCP